ncbi:MAG: hypothetical protein ACOC4K_05460 [Verrucomicrobiota bacterium]
MDWQIKTIAKKSAVSETPFSPGDRVLCLVYKEAGEPELGRADLLESEAGDFRAPGEVLGRWVRVVKDPGDEGAQMKETMASAEDFFFSLYENEPTEPEAREESEVLKHLLALMLERKRILRALPPRRSEGEQAYLHVKLKKEVAVPVVEISPELMLKIEDTIGELIL